MQKIVGGLIETVPYGKFDIVVNEEGKLDGLQPNRMFFDDILVGSFFITKANFDGDFVSLTDGEALQLLTDFDLVNSRFRALVTF